MKILFYPAPDGANEYTSNMVNSFETAAGENVAFSPNIKQIVLKPLQTFGFKKYDVAVINWLENNLRSSKNKLFVVGVLKFFVYILFFKLIAKKTVYVRHNVYPHNMPSKHAAMTKKIVDFAETLFDRKVAHSGHLIKAGYHYIPHPLYHTNNEFSQIKQEEAQSYYLIFGRVERYKRIHTLIEHWPHTEKLVIAGPASDNDYMNELVSKAAQRNIEFDIRFIPNQVVDALMANAKAVILSHAGDEMIVSGSFFHAISYGVPVIASSQPFLNWLNHDVGFSGLTVFNSMNEFDDLLKQAQTSSRINVLTEAETLFGEAAVQATVKDLLDGLKP